MSYSYQQTKTQQRAVGIGFVVVLHILLVWALVSGLARDVVKVIQHKVEVKLLEEPPPPPPPPPPPKKIEKLEPKAPPIIKEYVPPPEITPPRVEAPAAITAVKADPAPPPRPEPPPPPAKVKGSVKASGVCTVMPNPEYPAKALQDEISGQVTVRFRVNSNGRLAAVVSSSFIDIQGDYRSAFLKEISKALAGYQCNLDLDEATLEKVFVFKLE